MKKLIYIIMFIFCSFSVFASFGGETVSLITVDNCYDNIKVNVSGVYQIDKGEYNLSNCTMDGKLVSCSEVEKAFNKNIMTWQIN